jgi:hypothetical protein
MRNLEEVRQVIDEVANALAAAAPLSTALRRGLGDAAQNAADLEAAIDRASRAIGRLKPKGAHSAEEDR